MKVILQKEVSRLGRAGEVKEVSDGYARNYLLPKGLASMVSRHSLNVHKAQKKKIERLNKEAKEDKKKTAKKIKGKKITIAANADEKGTLYAGLDKNAVSKELKKQKFNIEPGEIKLKTPIKKLGESTVELELGGEKPRVKLEIIGN